MQDRYDPPVWITAAQCRELAAYHNAQASEAGITQRRTALLTHVARSFTALANQLDALVADIAGNHKKQGRRHTEVI